jgi:tetratricopeptide (TPR) repeat protein
MDVQRYLTDEPVQACPPSAAYHFCKFARRNKAALVAAAVVGLAILLAVGSFGWMALDQKLRHTRLNYEVELALKEASQERDRALTLTDNPYQWEAALDSAGKEVKSAERIAAHDEAALSTDLKDQLFSLRQALKADQQDRRFVARFNDIRLEQSELNPGWSNFKMDNAYPAIGKALDDFYDLRIGTTPVVEAKRAVLARRLPIQQYLLAALEVALMYASRGDAAAQAWLKDVLASVDTSPWRQRARQAVEAEDWQALESIVCEQAAARQPAADLLRYADRVPVKSTSKLVMLRLIRRTYPADFWANHQLANTFFACQPPQLDESIRYFTAAVALRPQSSTAVVGLATALRHRGLHEQALDAYQDAQRVRADNARAHVGMGWSLLALNRDDEALAEMREATRLQPGYAIGYWGLSSALVKQKKLSEAVEMAREAVLLDPRNSMFRIHLVNCLLRQELPAEAERELLEALGLYPSEAALHDSLGRVLEAQLKFKGAEQAYLNAFRLDPSVATYRRALEAQQKFKAAGTGPTPPAEGFTPLFNGKDLSGWAAAQAGTGMWKIEDGALTCTGPRDHLLTTRNDFGDFHLRAEVKINANGNSGIYFRASKPLVLIGDYEAQITDNPGQRYKTGSLYGLVRLSESPVPRNTWFTLDIIAIGQGIQVLVNGKQTADYTESRQGRNAKGHLALQHHDPETRVFFHKIEIKELSVVATLREP